MYNFKVIEERQQKSWFDSDLFLSKFDSNKPKYYVLEMLPYPSGALHIGHVRNYSIGDVIARFKRMQGFEVFHPIGWDSFGLPAENAAIKRGIAPADWTDKNISQMKEQLKKLGFSYDWTRELKTSDVSYYRWNQWLFSQMFDRGLAYKKVAFVNWSEKLQTVLANEQVEESFCGSGSDIVKKELNQWFLKITDYADDLLSGLDEIDWPEKVKLMQKNWIGRSEGIEVDFDVPGYGSVKVFTTRLDTIFGVSYLALSMGHSLSRTFSESNKKIEEYIKNAPLTKDEVEKNISRGIFTNHYAINPVNGARVPIWIADYVLDYGTKAVMGVPAHDERDHNFATLHKLNVVKVIESDLLPFVEYGRLISSNEFNGLNSEKAIEEIYLYLSGLGVAEKKINYRLKDWLISRQRYWGTPIPIHYEEDIPKLDRELPVMLPEDVEFKGIGNPIASSKRFRKDLNRDLDTMDTFFDSSWYYMRYLDNRNSDEIFDINIAKQFPQVDLYIGGVEHAVMHLLYARFIHRVLYDLGLVSNREPFKKLLTQGMVLANSYYSKKDGKYHFLKDIDRDRLDDYVVTLEKMSKSKNNGIAPEEIAETYGVDAMRVFILFAGPPEKDIEWSDAGINGAKRFLNRVWALYENNEFNFEATAKQDSREKELLYKLNFTIDKVTNALSKTLSFNVAIAALMEFLNDLYNYTDIDIRVFSDSFISFIKMLSPFAPHIADEIYQKLNRGQFLIEANWPEVDKRYLVKDEVKIAIQVNGKLRGDILVKRDSNRDEVIESAKVKVSKYLDRSIKKEIYIDNRIVNFVI